MIASDHISELEERMLEAIRVFDHQSCILTVLLARPVICDWTGCTEIAKAAVNAQPLCDGHAAKVIARLAFDSAIRALIDHFRGHGWLEAEDEGRAA